MFPRSFAALAVIVSISTANVATSFLSFFDEFLACTRFDARIMKETNCGTVKLEGGARMAETIHFLVERGIPVMGHIGLNPNPPKFVK